MFFNTKTVVFLLGGTIFSSASPLLARDNSDEGIQLPSGKYIGAHDANTSTTAYYAIPYAYTSRFEPSKFIDTKPGVSPDVQVNATVHGPSCINFHIPPPFDVGFNKLPGGGIPEPQSEDCLNLDIYVPDGEYTDLPVLFYTPGGGFLVGASFQYDMTPLVAKSVAMGQPMIAVSINYRLGPLGFLNPSTWGDEINLGLLDQVNALRWVQKYISAFGGSPDKVTIMGESAGAESTMHQLLWTDESFFRSAWMMSVPSSSTPFLATQPAFKDDLVKSYAAACGCAPKESIAAAVECLNKTNASTLVNQSVAWEGSMTSLGGSFVRNNVFDTIRKGEFPKVPLVVSVCRDEGTSEVIGFKSNSTQITSYMIYNLIQGRGLEGKEAADFLQQMLEAYPIDPALGCPYDGRNTTYNQPSQFKRMAAIATDSQYVEPWAEYLDTFSKKTDVWGILFEQPIPGIGPAYGAVHGSDIPYYFPLIGGFESDPRTHGLAGLVDTVLTAVVNFVNEGDPNGCEAASRQSGRYHWPVYSKTKKATALNATQGAVAVLPPHRPGFDVVHKFLRPGPFWDGGKQVGRDTSSMNVQQ